MVAVTREGDGCEAGSDDVGTTVVLAVLRGGADPVQIVRPPWQGSDVGTGAAFPLLVGTLSHRASDARASGISQYGGGHRWSRHHVRGRDGQFQYSVPPGAVATHPAGMVSVDSPPLPSPGCPWLGDPVPSPAVVVDVATVDGPSVAVAGDDAQPLTVSNSTATPTAPRTTPTSTLPPPAGRPGSMPGRVRRDVEEGGASSGRHDGC